MKHVLFCALSLIISATAFGSESNHKLIQPDSVQMKNQMLEIAYTANCSRADVSTIVMTSDDSADRVIQVGVVVSMENRNCGLSSPKQFFDRVSPLDYGYGDDENFVPMQITR